MFFILLLLLFLSFYSFFCHSDDRRNPLNIVIAINIIHRNLQHRSDFSVVPLLRNDKKIIASFRNDKKENSYNLLISFTNSSIFPLKSFFPSSTKHLYLKFRLCFMNSFFTKFSFCLKSLS